MNNNNNINDLIQKAQEMIKNDEVPNEIKQMVNNMSKKNDNNMETNSFDQKKELSSNIDMKQLMNMFNSFNSQTSNDDMSRLLFALKPYLRNEKKGKVDEYIKLIKMGKMAKLFDNLNNSSNK